VAAPDYIPPAMGPPGSPAPSLIFPQRTHFR
jgi:hypothetical protein